MSSDIVTRLQEAAAAAIANERPALESPQGRVGGVTIELMPSSTGQVHEVVAFVERRTEGPALAGREGGDRMSDDAGERFLGELRYRTFRAARVRGGLCANCGRDLAEGETVRLEPRQVSGHKRAVLRVPVARECVSPAFLARTEGQEPERCAGCGRGVVYKGPDALRLVALCSLRCRTRMVMAKRQAAKG